MVASVRESDQIDTAPTFFPTAIPVPVGANDLEAQREWEHHQVAKGIERYRRTPVRETKNGDVVSGGLEESRHGQLIATDLTWPKSYVFPAMTAAGWQYTTEDKPRGHATDGIQRAIDNCGLNRDLSKGKVTPHTFRDTFASRLVQADVSLLKVSHLLGHADESMTKKYAHLCPDSAGLEAAAVLDGLHAE